MTSVDNLPVLSSLHVYIGSLIPSPRPFYLPFAFTIIHGSGTGKAWEHSSRE